jgi:rhodanese-related sulfurtransferase
MVENVSPKASFAALLADPDAQLIDVRTDAEWQYVGIPDLRQAGKQAVLISWQYFPSGNVNTACVDELRDAGLTEGTKLYFLCRSGVRSLAAAEAAEAAGFAPCFNVAEGFEGHHDGQGHRGTVSGWKAEGLPWRQ